MSARQRSQSWHRFPGAVLWDIGSGSGAVSIDFLRMAGRGSAHAIDRDAAQCERATANAVAHGVAGFQAMCADAETALKDLPSPDAVFIGGGASNPVFRTAIARLRPGGVIVAHAVTIETESILVAHWQKHGGDLAQALHTTRRPGWRIPWLAPADARYPLALDQGTGNLKGNIKNPGERRTQDMSATSATSAAAVSTGTDNAKAASTGTGNVTAKAPATTGTLYGVGTGPGDAELVTRRAWRLIETARVIAYPAPDDGDSFARSIVTEAISADATEIVMRVPMRAGRAPAQSIYDNAAKDIAAHLDAGCDVVVLCEGDPLLYGSFMYVLARLKPNYPVEVVPGVTSLSACAAAHAMPLVARNDTLSVVPGGLEDDRLEIAIKDAEAIAIMKVGRHMPRLRQLLTKLGLASHTRYTSHASLPHQRVLPLDQAPDDAPYFSMLLIYRGEDPWIT